MSDSIVVYYSNSGNNRYLAEKISNELNCEMAEIKPRINFLPIVFLFTVLRFSFGNRKQQINLKDYKKVVLCSPIWFGRLASPMLSYIRKHKKKLPDQVFFATSCGGSDEKRRTPTGYHNSYTQIYKVLHTKILNCTAFPMSLILEDSDIKQEDIIKLRLNDDTFNEKMEERLDKFVKLIKRFKYV